MMPKSGVTVSVVLCGLISLCLCWSTVSGTGCDDGDVRLVGPNEFEGRVEFCSGKEWGQVCSVKGAWFSPFRKAAQVLCEQLGFNGTGLAFIGDVNGRSDRVFVQNFRGCTNTTGFNSSCVFESVNTTNCTYPNEMGNVICPAIQCQENSTRLVNGSNSLEGRVEVCIRSSMSNDQLYYGGVCDNNLDDSFATIVCKELNLTYSTSQVIPGDKAKYSAVGYHNVSCNGNETGLADCSHSILQDIPSKLPLEGLLDCTFVRVRCSGNEITTTALPHTVTTTDPDNGLPNHTSPTSNESRVTTTTVPRTEFIATTTSTRPTSDTVLAYVIGGIGVVILLLILVTVVCVIAMVMMVKARKKVQKFEKHIQGPSVPSVTDDINDQELFLQNPFYNNTLRNEKNNSLNQHSGHDESIHTRELNEEQRQVSSIDAGYAAILPPETSMTVPEQHRYNVLQRINSKEYSKLESVPDYANPILPPLSDVDRNFLPNEQVLLPHPYAEPVPSRVYSEPDGDPHSTGTGLPHTYAELEQTIPYTDSHGYAELDTVVQKSNHDACPRTNTSSTTYQNHSSTHSDQSHASVPSNVYENQQSYENQLYVHYSDNPSGDKLTKSVPESTMAKKRDGPTTVYYNLSDTGISNELPNTYAEPEQTLPFTDSQELEYDDIVVQKNTHEACSHTNTPSTTYQNHSSIDRDQSHTSVPSNVYENQGSYENQLFVHASDSPSAVDNGKLVKTDT